MDLPPGAHPLRLRGVSGVGSGALQFLDVLHTVCLPVDSVVPGLGPTAAEARARSGPIAVLRGPGAAVLGALVQPLGGIACRGAETSHPSGSPRVKLLNLSDPNSGQELFDGFAEGQDGHRSAAEIQDGFRGVDAQMPVHGGPEVVGAEQAFGGVFSPGVGGSDNLSGAHAAAGDQE